MYNSGVVGARERVEAERFYLGRAARELKDAYGVAGGYGLKQCDGVSHRTRNVKIE